MNLVNQSWKNQKRLVHNLKFKSYTKLWCKDSANPLWPKGKTYTPASVGVFLYHRTPAVCIKLDKFWRVLPDLSMMGGACLHKKRKNLRYFLEEAENRRNFASDLRFIHKFVS